MKQSEIDISKIQNLLQRIREKSSQGAYIYRGEAGQHGKIASGLYREYADKIDAKYFDIQIAQEKMLEHVKAYTDFTDETDVLTELQHYGGKTNLIDFTTDYLIALFFACDSSLQQAGRIILLNKNSNQGKISSPKKNLNNRVISQKSIFFQSPKGYLDEKDSAVEIISISQEMKQPVLDYLRKYHDITKQTIYNDIFGYIQNQKNHPTAYAEFYIGLSFQGKGEYEEAIKHYDEAIHLHPQHAPSYNNRGNVKHKLGRYEEEIADYNEAIRLNPQYADAYSNRGNAKSALDRHEEAIADCDQAIHLNPQLAGAYYNRGNAKSALDRHEEAIADYDEAIRLNPQYANAYFNRGIAKGNLDRHEEAIADYDQTIRLNSQHDKAYCNRGSTKGALGRHKEAIADFNEAIRINPQSADAYYNRGNANKEIGDCEKARVDLQRAFELATEQGNQTLAQNARRLLGELPPAGGEKQRGGESHESPRTSL